MPLYLILTILAALVILANHAEGGSEGARRLLTAALLGVTVVFVAVYGFLPTQGTPFTLALALIIGGGAALVIHPAVRVRLSRFFPVKGAAPNGEGFDPASPLHLTALVFLILLVGNSILTVALAGGLSGLAAQYTSPTGGSTGLISPSALLTQMGILIGIAALGVGFGTRRTLREVVARLGLRAPTFREVRASVNMAFFLFVIVYIAGTLWSLLTPTELLDEQTALSALIGEGIDTLVMAFFIALSAAVGEEIAFRGTLQPVFGFFPTTLFFVAIHTQYTLTPAALIIFVAALGFAHLRRRYNTTTAIICHFLYNYVPLALLVYTRVALELLQRYR
ncbi:MAG TPA: CPBP family intramembrane metalloprotease [Aggregatilineales bacterium]|nr:CPBP family intramembrane metalloprotease [Anaerolineales bacterium]HRE48894.1 CPBP family intramembrane metalloprotease [Aggregatilineales bacterium]